MLKNHPLVSVLVGLLFLLALGTCWLAVQSFFAIKQLEAIQARSRAINTTLALAQNLSAEAAAYSRTSPEMAAALQKFVPKPPGLNTNPTGELLRQ